MKYTIEGFSQEYALTLKKTVPTKNGKKKEIKIDFTDFVILRWFVDFYPNMRKMTVDGREYAWLSHNKMLADLPLLDISKKACIERMQKLVEFEILDYRFIKDGGTFSLYTFGKNYINLVSDEKSTDYGVGGQPTTGVGGQPATKDKSIINKSIIDKSIKEYKKERKKENSYDEILNTVENEELRETFAEFIKMRKLTKNPMTDRALQMLIKKVELMYPGDIELQKKVLDNAIINNWKSVYPLKPEEIPQQKKKLKYDDYEEDDWCL